jgi:hypothetical protein
VLAAGALSAFASTLASARALRRKPGGRPGGRAGGRALLPWSVYRCALALMVIRRLRRARNGSR